MTPRRRPPILLILVAVLAAACSSPPNPAGRGSRRPNLLIFTFDTTRADHLSIYGGEQAPVPNLERLAAGGVRFDAAFAPTPITLPSHVSLFTGLYPAAHGVLNNGTFRLREDAHTLAEALLDRGFETGAVVGSGVLDSQYGLDQGFQSYDDELPPEETVKALFVARRAEEVVDRGLTWLGERGDAPWFLWLHFFDPHWEYAPPEPFASRYAEAPYDGEIVYADAQAGRVLEFLRQRGWEDDTLVILAADHGESLGEHGESTHGLFVYDATMRVPLVMRLPGRLPAARTVAPVVRLIDVFPTVLDLLEVPYEAGEVQGKSLLPLVEGSAEPPRTAWLTSWSPLLDYGWSELRAVRDATWKYIQAPRPELYEMPADPGEEQNLADARPERATEYRQRLEELEIALAPGESLAESRQPEARTRRALESLGYVSLGGGSESGPRADPKDRIATAERINEALAQVNRQRFDLAVPLLEALVEESPGSPFLQRHLGNALLQEGRRQEGLERLERALELDPGDIGQCYEC